MHDDFDFDPVPGLPEELPKGERMLWQGAPDWRRIAISALHVRAIAIYFGILAIYRGAEAIYEGGGLVDGLIAALWIVPLALGACGILALIAYFIHRTTIYTITDKRVVFRIGVTLPMTINVPFTSIQSAAYRAHGDGTGDIPIQLDENSRIAYPLLWPHARPWRLKTPEPMLRGVPEGEKIARLLQGALAGESVEKLMSINVETSKETSDGHAGDFVPAG
ncbi:MAG: photosynthetic complex putative assembly protein PuhB [Alphaproteobacteria bacterium]|nr:photosynthetic complex putative assembly protein PuhB [Alphaproteobacteria bacterium]